MRRFSYACERERDDDRIVDLMIAAESLFLSDSGGEKDRGEIRFRLALRSAYFVESPAYTRRQIFNHMKAAYDLRSAIVHGDGRLSAKRLKDPRGTPVALPAFCSATAELLRIALKGAIEEVHKRGKWPLD